MEKELTVLETNKAMLVFLEKCWLLRGKPEQVGNVLSAIQLQRDTRTADPAAWFDWLEAIEEVTSQKG